MRDTCEKKSLPDRDESWVVIFCGERTLLINNGNFSQDSEGNKGHIRSVEESIGLSIGEGD